MRYTQGGLAAIIAVAAGLVMAGDVAAQEAEPRSDFRLDLGGYGSVRYEINGSDEVPSSITLRRFVLAPDARYRNLLQVYGEIELERLSEIEVERSVESADGGLKFEQELEGTNGSELALEQAWAQLNFSPAFGLRFGAVLPPVGRFNIRHDDNLWNTPRRPLIDKGATVLPASAAWTEMGIGFTGTAELGETAQLGYQAYLLNGAQLDFAIEQIVQTRTPRRDKLELEAAVSPTAGAFDGSNTTDAFAARLALSPALASEYAVSGYFGRYTPDFMDVEKSITTLGFDGAQKLGSFFLEGEFLYTKFDGVEDVARSFAAAAAEHATETTSGETADLESEIEIELTGLADKRYGLWVDLGRPIALGEGTFGFDAPSLIPTVRYERVWYDGNVEELDFSAGAVTALEQEDRGQQRVSVGVAFRPVPSAVLQLFYERNDARNGLLLDPGIEAESTNAITLGMAFGF